MESAMAELPKQLKTERYKERRALGLCWNCPNKARSNRVMCLRCAIKHNDRNLRYYKNKTAAKPTKQGWKFER